LKKISRKNLRRWCILALVLLSFVLLPNFGGGNLRSVITTSAAATCVTNPVVTSTADSGPGSLRQAIAEACPGSTITFADTGTITLTSGELDINENLAIQGPGANLLTVSGNNTALHVFNIGMVTPALDVTLSGLTITGGNADTFGEGGLGDRGAGILFYDTGTLNVTGCTISGNANPIAGGGGIYNMGTLNVTNSTISDNTAHDEGAGVSNLGTANITNSTISGNTVAGQGGGISNDQLATLKVTGCTISGNSSGTKGGGIFNFGMATVAESTITGNSATFAGGVYNDGMLSISNTTMSANTATAGGAIFNGGVTLTAVANIINSTISGNAAIFGSGFFNNDKAAITNSTIAGNTASASGAIFSNGTTTIKNTIVALNMTGTDPDVFGAFTSQGHNLIGKEDGSAGFVNGVEGDQVGSSGSPINPKLGPLQNNGGPTATLALLPGSPAIDAGDDSVLGPPLSLTTDQRGPGFPRKSGAHVDIGAFEFQVFDTCLKDNSNGNLLEWNSTTGEYSFTNCSNGFMLTGTGTVGLASGMRTLMVSTANVRISAALNSGQRTGSATIYIMVSQGSWQLFRITDTNPSAVCACEN
jgi:hypothetical protein